MSYGILICHGQLAQELIQTVQAISGTSTGLYGFSNARKDLAVLQQEILRLMDRFSGEAPLIFVDLWGGSCWRVGMQLCREKPGIRLVSGVNVPMLLSFLSKRERLPYQELVEKVCLDGQRGIQVPPASSEP